MSHLSDPDRLERLAGYALADPMSTTTRELAEALLDAAARIRHHQALDLAARRLLASLDREDAAADLIKRHAALSGGCTCRRVPGRPARSSDIDPACPVHIPTDPKDPTP